ncbi:FIST N-terminal domain-containing protein [Methylobacterium sp. ID0610]|uniref:FIST N-terminal domain-containing protein n=1 Tax=Methylobacterium carpenticola TaxID=3344827 RepID=UPI0036778326
MTQGIRSCSHRCGIQTAWTDEAGTDAAVAALAEGLDRERIGHLVIFFSPRYGADRISAAFARHFPGVHVAGCTSSGEISPVRGLARGLVAIAFPRAGFRIASVLLERIGELEAERAAESLRQLRGRLDAISTGGRRFAISLIDGLANAEEAVIAAVSGGLDGVPLVGGSAGDELTFHDTALIHNGVVHRRAAILLLIETDFAVEIFKNHNFEPTETKFVVTDTDHERRVVRELNAEPAAEEYARALGTSLDALTPTEFAANPLVVRIGGDYFCRSIRHIHPDGSLSFFCAVDEGVVLTLARQKDIVAATREELVSLDARLGGLDLVIGFECVLRRLDAELHQVRHCLSDLYRQYNVVGFETYGEQFRSMHLNQTFTGIAIGGQSVP